MKTLAAIALALAACASPDESSRDIPLTCEDAIQHYYESGCSFSESRPATTPALIDHFIEYCVAWKAFEPATCNPKFDAVIECAAETPDDAGASGSCGCQAVFESIRC